MKKVLGALGAAGAAAGSIGTIMAVGSSIAQVAPTHRECTIEITNNCINFSLCNPRKFIESGGCATPLSPFIAPSQSDTFLFSKTPHTARGSVGVFTYDLLPNASEQECKEKIAVMFSVPYDFNLYYNWYAVGVFDEKRQCDHNLYREMYYNTNKTFIRGKARDPSLIYQGDNVTIIAAMSDTYQPVIKVQVTEKKR